MAMILRLKPKAEPCPTKGKPAPVLRFRPRHAQGVPDAALPALDALADMIAADVVREYRRPKMKLQFRKSEEKR